MTAFIGWIVTGLFVGLIARAIVPGRQSLSMTNTIMVGIMGAVLGGLASSLIWPAWAENPSVDRMWPGWLMSVTGGVVVLWAFTTYTGRRNITNPR